MVTMVDEIYDRHYREGRDQLNAALTGLFRRFGSAFGNAFKVLNRIEYTAPWGTKSKRARSN
jgi:hypothetical protein